MERAKRITWGWYLLPILADCNNFICSCQKNFMWGVASRLCPPMILRMSFSKLSLIPIPCCSIFVCICYKRSSRSFTCNLVDVTVARNLSGPHACKEALDLAGVAEALLFFRAARFTVLETVAQG